MLTQHRQYQKCKSGSEFNSATGRKLSCAEDSYPTRWNDKITNSFCGGFFCGFLYVRVNSYHWSLLFYKHFFVTTPIVKRLLKSHRIFFTIMQPFHLWTEFEADMFAAIYSRAGSREQTMRDFLLSVVEKWVCHIYRFRLLLFVYIFSCKS